MIAIEPVAAAPPTRFSHGATLIETPGGLLAAWFGGRFEGCKSTQIWTAAHDGQAWSTPTVAADVDTPMWNPVLHRDAASGETLLFFRYGPSPQTWRAAFRRSNDDGASWRPGSTELQGCLGPIRSKPLEIAPGRLLCPSSEESRRWRAHFEVFSLATSGARRAGGVPDPNALQAIQPSAVAAPDGRILAFFRTRARVVATSSSDDLGETWTPLRATALPNPNSAVDVAQLADGRLVLAHNADALHRDAIQLSLSEDGERWRSGPTLQAGDGEQSYPSLVAHADGGLSVAWTAARRRIAVARLAQDAL